MADRSRSGTYLVMLLIAAAMFGIFFFLSLFVQTVLGYSGREDPAAPGGHEAARGEPSPLSLK